MNWQLSADMYQELKFLARINCRRRHARTKNNYVKLIIRRPEKKTMLQFHVKPPVEARKYMRVYNYRWSRNYRYWHCYLSKDKPEQIKKILLFLNEHI